MALSEKLLLKFLDNPTLELAIETLEGVLGREGVDVWLKMPNPHLEDRTPQSLIDNGYEKIVMNLVADMVTGSPS